MDFTHLISRSPTRPRRANSQSQNPRASDLMLNLSQPKPRHMIKINKSKLPIDFFPQSKKITDLKYSLREDINEISYRPRKAESERKHISPQKTSFFGFFEEAEQQNHKKSAIKVYNRKFQTRQEPKRETAHNIEAYRKLTPATKSIKNDLLQLFPSTLDQQTAQIIISSNKTKSIKSSPRKEHLGKYREIGQQQQIIDPERANLLNSPRKESKSGPLQGSIGTDMLNMTFFNVKSTCFPPISNKSSNLSNN